MNKLLAELKNNLEGEIYDSLIYRSIYATDASVYREIPLAVVYPKSTNDIKTLIHFAQQYKIPLIPRGSGTSLAGQVVGKGIIVDISKHFNNILDLNINEKTVTVQPGVILDELNLHLSKHKLFFGPETSTSSRCTIEV
jgi:FAD/FMN-containing dehydrogenase